MSEESKEPIKWNDPWLVSRMICGSLLMSVLLIGSILCSLLVFVALVKIDMPFAGLCAGTSTLFAGLWGRVYARALYVAHVTPELKGMNVF